MSCLKRPIQRAVVTKLGLGIALMFGLLVVGAVAAPKENTITIDEIAILQNGSPYQVAFSTNYAPISYLNEDGEPAGIAVQVMDLLVENGLFEIEYLPLTGNRLEGVDICLSVLDDHSQLDIVTMSEVYLDLPFILLTRESQMGNITRVSSMDYYNVDQEMLADNLVDAEVLLYHDWEEMLDDFARGTENAVLLTTAGLNSLRERIQLEEYVVQSTNMSLEMRMEFTAELSEGEIAIFNRLIDQASEARLSYIVLDESTGATREKDVFQILEEKPELVLGAVLFLVTVIVIAVGYVQYRHQKMLQRMLNVDPLTGLYTNHKMAIEVKKHLATNSEGCTLISVDIDNFKHINAMYGYEKGTEILVGFAHQLREQFSQPCDLLARVAGDTFLILTQSVEEGICIRSRKPCQRCQGIQTADWVEGGSHFNISLGIYPIDNLDEAWSHMVDCANRARLAQKNVFGRPCGVFSDEMRQAMEREYMVTSGMERAIAQEEFYLYYQPKIDLSTGKCVGAEALVRWIYDGKLIPPGQFIPVFEKNGFITRLDYYVMDQVCRFINTHRTLDIPSISLNLSGITMLEYDLVERLLEIAQRYDIPPAWLDLEITESSVVPNFERAVHTIDRLREAGFSLSIDDFGTGISTLHRLKDLSLDVLKIDRSFIVDTIDNPKGVTILRSIIQLSKDLQIQTVAEGIETKEQMELVKQLGCDVGQGYFFARPLHQVDFLAWLEVPEERKDV